MAGTKQTPACHPQPWELLEEPGDLTGGSLLAKTLSRRDWSSAEITEVVVSVPSPVVFLPVSDEACSWGSCKVPSSVCNSQGSRGSDFENMNTPEGTASFAFALLLNVIGRERGAAPKLPGLKVTGLEELLTLVPVPLGQLHRVPLGCLMPAR